MEKGEKQNDTTMAAAFDMTSLSTNLPQTKRGLSRYYTGKARSFTCLMDHVNSIDDLKKKDQTAVQYGKKMKYLQRRTELRFSPYPCQPARASVSFVGV